VPTMGFLHEGHLRLVDRARERADRVVMSIFVNPLQFGAGEDFATYPRDVDRDKKLAAERNVDCLFLPDAPAMYPADPLVRLHPGPMADELDGAARPGHLAAVLPVGARWPCRARCAPWSRRGGEVKPTPARSRAGASTCCGPRAWHPSTWPS